MYFFLFLLSDTKEVKERSTKKETKKISVDYRTIFSKNIPGFVNYIVIEICNIYKND